MKKLIAILCAVAVMATSLFGALIFTAVAEDAVVPMEAANNDTVIMPEYVDELGNDINLPYSMDFVPSSVLTAGSNLDVELVKNVAGLPFQSLFEISGGATDREKTDSLVFNNKQVVCENTKGFMFYIEVPNMETYTFEYQIAAVKDPETGEIITPATTATKTSDKFQISLRANTYDTSAKRTNSQYAYSGMPIYTLAEGSVSWTANTMNGYGMAFSSGFKGYVYVPFTSLYAPALVAADDIFYGMSLLELTACDNYYQSSAATIPLHGYIPAGEKLVVSSPVLVTGPMDVDADESGRVLAAENVLPDAEFAIIGEDTYRLFGGKVVDYKTTVNQNLSYSKAVLTPAYSTVNWATSGTYGNKTAVASTSLLTNQYATYVTAYRTYDSTIDNIDTMASRGDLATPYLWNSIPSAGGFLFHISLPAVDGPHAVTMTLRGTASDGTTYNTRVLNTAVAGNSVCYLLKDGATTWETRTEGVEADWVDTYKIKVSDGTEPWSGYIFVPKNAINNWGTGVYNITNIGVGFTPYRHTNKTPNSQEVYATISMATIMSSIVPTSTLCYGDDGRLVDLVTGELIDTNIYDAHEFNGNADLVDKSDAMQLTTIVTSSRNDKNTAGDSTGSVTGTFASYSANGFSGTLVKNNTVFEDSLFRVTGAAEATSGKDMVQLYFDRFYSAEHDGYMIYFQNNSADTLYFAFQPYGTKAGGGTDYNQVNESNLPFLKQVDGVWTWTKLARVESYTYGLAPGERGFIYLSVAALRSSESYYYLKIRTGATAAHATVNADFTMSAPILVDNFTEDAAGLAYVNGAEITQDLYTGEFAVPADKNGSLTVDLLDLVKAKDDKAYRDSYLNNYFNAAEYEPVLSTVFCMEPLEYVIGDSSTALLDNPDRGYRSEMVIYLAEKPLTIAEADDYTPELLKGTGYTVDVSANAIYDSFIASGAREPEIETDYDVSFAPAGNPNHSDRYPFGDGSGGAVHTVTVDILQAWINAHNNYVQARINASDGAYNANQKLIQASGEAQNDFYSRAAVHLVSNYMIYELNQATMFVSELAKVVYLTDAQKEQVVYTGAWRDKNFTIDGVERYIRVEGNASGKNFFYYDNAGTRVYNQDGSLNAIKVHVYHDPRTLFGSDENSTNEWSQRLASLFRQYKIGYSDIENKVYYTRTVTYADGSQETIEVANKLFNAYVSLPDFAYKADANGNTQDMPESIMSALDFFFKYCGKVGAKANFRPSYNTFTQNAYLNQAVVGYQQFRANVERQCADEATMIAHIKQMAPVIAENKEVIHNISSGWIGFGGEMAAGFQYPPVSYKNVITAILDYHCIPNGLYFSTRSTSYITNIINGVATNNEYNSGNLDLKGIAADPAWAEKYAKWCGFNNDAFFGEQNFPAWGSSGYYEVGNTSYIYDTANAAYTPNDGELYTNGSHVFNLRLENGKYVWVGFDDSEGKNKPQYNDTDNMVPTPIEAIRELAHHRYTDFSQWHGFLDVATPNVMTFWMDHDAEWVFEGDVDSVNGNGGYFNAAERAELLGQVITPELLEANGIAYDPAWFAIEGRRNAYEFIRDHLGYRLVAQTASVNINPKRSDKVTVSIDLKNYGFSAAFCMESSIAILDKDGNVVQEIKAGNPETWYNLAPDYYTLERASSAQNDVLTHTVSAQFDRLGYGEYYIAFRLENTAGETARLANDVEYVNGYNILGSFTYGK